MDYRTINVGQQTSAGTVKHIYGQAEGFIVFLDTNDEPRLFTERKDEVYLKSVQLSKNISATYYKKLKRVKIHDFNDHLSACLVDSMMPDVKVTELKKIFKPAVDFIKQEESIKRVIARGPNPLHIIYITKSNNLGWESKKIPEHAKSNLAKLDMQRQMSLTLIPSFLRGSVVSLIGNALTAVIRSNDGDDLSEIINKSDEHLESRIKEFNFILYFFASIIVTAIVYGIIFLTGLNSDLYSQGVLGGSLGALISALQRTKPSELSIYESRIMISIQALSRALLGLISGLLLVAASKANIAMGFLSEEPQAIFIFGIAVGFAERWMPDFLKSLTQKSIDNNSA